MPLPGTSPEGPWGLSDSHSGVHCGALVHLCAFQANSVLPMTPRKKIKALFLAGFFGLLDWS